MKLSPQQKKFVDWAANGRGSCVLEAVAGAGKTTAILAAVDVIGGNSAILAFNRPVADEIADKLKAKGVDFRKAQAGTVHSFGFSALRKAFPGITIDEDKVRKIVEAACLSGRISHETGRYGATICKLVGFAKQAAAGVLLDAPIDDLDLYLKLGEHYDLFDEIEEEFPIAGAADPRIVANKIAARKSGIARAARWALKQSNDDTATIDFNDMVYLPLIHRVRFWRFANVFVDEAQDTNPVRRALVRAIVQPGGRVIAVGDRHQAIYGFTGADARALDLIAADFNAARMPLTVSFRCPASVVGFVRQWVSHIQSAPGAPVGEVRKTTLEAFLSSADALSPGSAMVCRNTRPLVSTALALLRQGIACKIEGRDIAAGIKRLATKWARIKTFDALENRLEVYLQSEKTKLLAAQREQKAQEVEDMVETLRVLMSECRRKKLTRVDDLVAEIDALFSDDVRGVFALSTIHKSKGREWERVYWLDRAGTCPSKYARQEWQVEQELNLCYVAGTRAKQELIEVEVPPKAVGAARRAA